MGCFLAMRGKASGMRACGLLSVEILQSTPKDSQAASTTGPAGPLKSFALKSEPLNVFVENMMSNSSSNGAVNKSQQRVRFKHSVDGVLKQTYNISRPAP